MLMNAILSTVGSARLSVGRCAGRCAGRARLSTAPGSGGGLVELREYALKPDKAAAYLAATRAAAAVRHEHVPTRLCSMPETGGQLQGLFHMLLICLFHGLLLLCFEITLP